MQDITEKEESSRNPNGRKEYISGQEWGKKEGKKTGGEVTSA